MKNKCNVVMLPTENEEWRDIEGYEEYQISNLGKIRMTANSASRKERELKPLIAGKGYFRVALYKDKKPHFKSIHRLVAEHFIPNPENKAQVNHLDGNKANNAVSNLEWCTYRENITHAIENGLSSHGERNGNAKLDWSKVNEIRDSALSTRELVDKYKVSKTTINSIKANRIWIKENL